MMSDDRPDSRAPRLSTEEARAGSTPHMTRYVLGWGLLLVIFAFVTLLAYYMLRT